MSNQPYLQPWDRGEEFYHHLPEAVKTFSAILQEHGFETYVVGGAVRDFVLNEKPKDFDLVTSATPIEIKKIFRRSARIIGRRFQLVHLFDSRGNLYEVSTFRRSPTLEERQGKFVGNQLQIWNDNFFGTLPDDVWRRDFSVNALYYTPQHPDSIIDLTGGLQDLAAKKLRILGDASERLQEDPVRILRALKLIAQFDFVPEESLNEAILTYLPSIRLASPSRLSEELRKIVLRPFTYKTFQVFIRYQFMTYFWPSFQKFNIKNQNNLLKYFIRKRDHLLTKESYSASRALAFSTLALPYILDRLHIQDFSEFPLHSERISADILQYLINFYFDLLPPKFILQRVRAIILLLPYFYHGDTSDFVMMHPEYKYARELFLLLHAYYQWPSHLLQLYPTLNRRKKREFDPNSSEAEEFFVNKKKHSKYRKRKKKSPTGEKTSKQSEAPDAHHNRRSC